ncbi:MAG TPA: hypothetical protein VJU59_43125 [Paraburkholderia sp.]|uniref:hypothetical protein n=1 Tax=Paraburkholderia sp. TaxID=1926495 RepID=UPI002B4A7EA7|nr:hypothetical protein [Paraburkholderia sp.]HKR46385.1 hypothetical protein [Paraburkholderia sp.]
MKIVDLVCIVGVIGTFALVSHASLSMHIRKMKEAIESEPFALMGVTRREASAQLLEWEAQKKRVLPTAILLTVVLCTLDGVFSFAL